MSSKSTIFMTNCCHIYKDVEYINGNEIERLCIDVDYLALDGYETIEVLWKSDFAELIRTIFNTLDNEKLDQICRDYWRKNLNPQHNRG